MNIQPLASRILIKRDKAEAITKGGLHLPQTSQKEPQRGKVLAVGPGTYYDGKLLPVAVKPGDNVVFAYHTGLSLNRVLDFLDRDDDLILVAEHDLLATVS